MREASNASPMATEMEREKIRLMGTREIGVALGGISRQRVDQLIKRDTFPQPIVRLSQGKVWLAEEVEAWIAVHRTKQGPLKPPTASGHSGAAASVPRDKRE
jgi:prophage regulatory protein